MTVLCCSLPVSKWLISEVYDSPSEFTASTTEITLFGKVTDSDEQILYGFTFQVAIVLDGLTDKLNEVKIYDHH